MKYIKEIPNNHCKCSLFAWNNKYIIKFEAGMYEQIYKVSEMDVLGEGEIDRMLNETFLIKVLDRFKQMAEDFNILIV